MKIMMVCLGNICRSPLAEGIMRDLIQKNELDWEVASCGTSGFHNGEPPHVDSVSISKERGIDISWQISSKLRSSDLRQYDLILAMDSSNYHDIIKLSDSEEQRKKVKLLMNFASPGRNIAVPDPYYVGGFDIVFDMIYEACEALIEQYKAES